MLIWTLCLSNIRNNVIMNVHLCIPSILYINLYVSYYLHLSKYIDTVHLCYIYLASFTSPVDLSQGKSILSSISITLQSCAKDLYEKMFVNVFLFSSCSCSVLKDKLLTDSMMVINGEFPPVSTEHSYSLGRSGTGNTDSLTGNGAASDGDSIPESPLSLHDGKQPQISI